MTERKLFACLELVHAQCALGFALPAVLSYAGAMAEREKNKKRLSIGDALKKGTEVMDSNDDDAERAARRKSRVIAGQLPKAPTISAEVTSSWLRMFSEGVRSITEHGKAHTKRFNNFHQFLCSAELV